MPVLAAIDFSETSKNALRYAAREAAVRSDELIAVHCIDRPDEGGGVWKQLFDTDTDESVRQMRERAEEELRQTVDRELDDEKRPSAVECEVVLDRPVDGVVETAEAYDADLVVTGATGVGRTTWLVFGSTSEAIVGASPAPVLVVPRDAEPGPWRRLLAPVDFSTYSRGALTLACRLADRDGGNVTVMHEASLSTSQIGRPDLAPSDDVLASFRTTVENRLESLLEECEIDPDACDTRLHVHAYRSVNPSEAIVDQAEELRADAVVMGTHGRRGLERVLMGSTTSKVLRQMPCPILTVSHPAELRGTESEG